MSKHTPGPWHVGSDIPLIIYAADGYAIGDAKTFDGRIPPDEAKANARLIAAAPELLEACKAAEEFMHLIGKPAPPAPWRQLVDAIAKAEGGATP